MIDWTPEGLNPLIWLDFSRPDTLTLDADGKITDASNLGVGQQQLAAPAGFELDYKSKSDGHMPHALFSGAQELAFNGSALVGKEISLFFAFFNTPTSYETQWLIGGSGTSTAENLIMGYRNADFRLSTFGSDTKIPISNLNAREYINYVASGVRGLDGSLIRVEGQSVTNSETGILSAYPGASIGKGIGNYFKGGMYEILIFDRKLALDEVDKVEAYLALKTKCISVLTFENAYRLLPYSFMEPDPVINASKVSGTVQIDGTPAKRTVRAFGYDPTTHDLNATTVNLSKSLGHSTSDPATGDYTIDLLAGYGREIFVVAFDDYGAPFTPEATLAAGDRIHPTTPNGHVWETTGAGALPVDEPTWVVDTETSQLYGTASMIARPFYRPMVHGPIMPEVTTPDPAP
ncbi:hypothetical protein MIH18_23820 (plasmid) [Marinobacter sp. M3C]|uniref:hypothetical protein n=1 Tax=Marinobacter sp. M3C TaxID=2917715 RepID=UPI00200E2A6B|nr:hypothetical protein [Marinobacter sp. M3C]MCL1485186.1 hypothetical protein [Marinobacter sp.]UQG62790.1 hypothetical protein MIH18_23820 [Marinobacter sp. M3C]